MLVWVGGGAAAAEPGYEEAPVVSAPAVGKARLAGLKLNRRSGTAVLFVRVLEPGRVVLHGRGLRRLVRGAPQPTVLRLPVKPKIRLRHYLKRHGKGRIRAKATFIPQIAEPRTLEKVIVLRRKRR